MDEQDKRKAAEWVDSHLAPVCPSCHSPGPFAVLDEFVAAPVLTKGAVLTTARFVPLIALACEHCGNVRFFSAITMGIGPPAATPRGQPPAARS
jgi:hypothetical protein